MLNPVPTRQPVLGLHTAQTDTWHCTLLPDPICLATLPVLLQWLKLYASRSCHWGAAVCLPAILPAAHPLDLLREPHHKLLPKYAHVLAKVNLQNSSGWPREGKQDAHEHAACEHQSQPCQAMELPLTLSRQEKSVSASHKLCTTQGTCSAVNPSCCRSEAATLGRLSCTAGQLQLLELRAHQLHQAVSCCVILYAVCVQPVVQQQ